ncbi:A24 family peptidase [Paenibacillus sp. NEAU-GSW1]|uniref:A24 family peptidase n=1 Tax=Paenibacillus sp. NEAU-GSW1 TaxID=2682486 RepID=UPI001564A92B
MAIPLSIPLAAAAMLLGAALYTDLRSMIIPNKLTFSFFIAGLLFQLSVHGRQGLKESLLGAAAGFAPLLLLYAAKGIGAGDVKLFGALGAWIGAMPVLHVMMYSILFAGLIGVVLMIVNRPFFKRMAAALLTIVMRGGKYRPVEWAAWMSEGRAFPFMLAAVPGAIAALLS